MCPIWSVMERRLERATDEVRLERVTDRPGLVAMQNAVEQVHVSEAVGYYIVDLVAATRTSQRVQVGASPRGALALLKLSRCRAALQGRDFVTPDDVKELVPAVLAHRVSLAPEAEMEGLGLEDVLRRIFEKVEVPR